MIEFPVLQPPPLSPVARDAFAIRDMHRRWKRCVNHPPISKAQYRPWVTDKAAHRLAHRKRFLDLRTLNLPGETVRHITDGNFNPGCANAPPRR
jgi:hypothetical protein